MPLGSATGFTRRIFRGNLTWCSPATMPCSLPMAVSGMAMLPPLRMPGTRQEFWEAKIARNREVDARSEQALTEAGWRLGIVWNAP